MGFLMLAALVVAQRGAEIPRGPAPLSVEASHDPLRNESTSVLTIGRVFTDPEPWRFKADLSFVFKWSGLERPPATGDEAVQVVVVVRSRDGGFEADDPKDLAILVGDTRIHDTQPDYVMDFVDEDVERKGSIPTRLGRPPMPIIEVTRVHLCKETLVWSGPISGLQRLFSADSTFGEMAVGKRRWRIEPEQYAAIRTWLSRLAVTEPEARRAEDAARKKGDDAAAAQRARVAPYRADIEAAVEKAEKAKRSVPKARYETIGEKLKRRTFDREIEAIRKKHNLSDGDIRELLKDWPGYGEQDKAR